MNDPKKIETTEATAQEPEAKQEAAETQAQQAAAEADAPIEETALEGVAGGGIDFSFDIKSKVPLGGDW